MSDRILIEDEWQVLAKTLKLNKEDCPSRYFHMRNAFFAGMGAAFGTMDRACSLSKEVGVPLITDIRDQLTQHFVQIREKCARGEDLL